MWAQLASLVPGLANLFTQLPMTRSIAKAIAGIPQQRTIPAFAPQTFKSWFKNHKKEGGADGAQRVILWPDTFNNHFFPETAIAAVEVLESAGCDVLVPNSHYCCGRPLYDYGFLDMAKRYLQRTMSTLGPEIDRGTPMVVLEPSCCSVFRDELTNLFPGLPRATKLKEQTLTLAEFLHSRTDYQIPTLRRKAVVHGHCHHKAIMRTKGEEALFNKMGLQYEMLDSGCCGMAGSFGFEADKYEVSVKVGERALLPAVRRADDSTLVVADGFSCREQISQLTNRQPLHTAEVLSLAMHSPDLSAEHHPESPIVSRREKAQKHSMITAGVALLTIVAAGMAFAFARRR